MNKNQRQKDEHNFKVMIRIRPPQRNYYNEKETIDNINISQDEKRIQISEYQETLNQFQNNYAITHSFSFDQIFGFYSTQQDVFDQTGLRAVENVFQGYNSTILAYGQTGTGKTYTIEGNNNPRSKEIQEGLIPRSVQHIFDIIEQQKIESEKIIVRVSYLQIYNETITDLLRPERSNLQIRQNKEKGAFVENLSEFIIRNNKDAMKLLKKGQQFRTTASTNMNEVSSRSHAVFMITVERLQTYIQDGKEIKKGIIGVMNLVDLAGSERLKVTKAKGKRLEESKNINQSLSCLGKVIAFLTDKNMKKLHIPYRESKLTRLLERSFGGNCITIFMAMISPGMRNFNETLQTLKFAKNAKKIKNKPKINQNLDQKSLLVRYEAEIKQLKIELAQKNKAIFDKANVLELEEKHQKAQKDKQDALRQLELRTQAFIKEREEKKMLKQKIEYLEKYVMSNNLEVQQNSQLVFDYKYQKEQIEKEKQQVEQSNCKSQQYQNLLLQQRDIMQALTLRLKERDEAIAELQQELEASDKIQNETEELLEIKNQRVQQLENILNIHNIKIPEFQNQSQENQTMEEEEFQMIENKINQQQFQQQEQEIIENLKEEFENKINILNSQHLQQQQILQQQLNLSEKNNKELIEVLEQKYKKQINNTLIQKNIKIMKQKINNIIRELSNDTNQDNLQLVAEELLSLHNFISTIDNRYEQTMNENSSDNQTIKQSVNEGQQLIEKNIEKSKKKSKKKILNRQEENNKKINYQKRQRKDSRNQKKTKIQTKKGYQTSDLIKFFPSQLN